MIEINLFKNIPEKEVIDWLETQKMAYKFLRRYRKSSTEKGIDGFTFLFENEADADQFELYYKLAGYIDNGKKK